MLKMLQLVHWSELTLFFMAFGMSPFPISQPVRDRIVAGDHQIELTLVMVVGNPHVADREVDLDSPSSRLDLGSFDRPG